MDISSFSAALSSLTSAADIAKLIRDSGLTLEKAEIKLKLADLISTLADAKIQLAEIRETLIEKDGLIQELRAQVKTKGEVAWDPPYYWLQLESGRDGPFCQKCYDTDKTLIRLQGNGSGYWQCKACKSDYRDKTYDNSPVIAPSYKPYSPFDDF